MNSKSIRSSRAILFVILSLLLAAPVFAQRQQQPAPPKTYADVSYAPYESTRLDFWQAKSDTPTPLVVYIHGGGFTGGTKDRVNGALITKLLKAGISFASVEYRLAGVEPLPAAHQDAKRAIQFLRTKAKEWNLDKNRLGATGGSAGAQLCLYLALHDEMADKNSAVPLERESTRLTCAAVSGCQITMDLNWWVEHVPGYTIHRNMLEIYGVSTEAELKPLVREASVMNHVSKDDPPVWMSYGMTPDDPIPDDERKAGNWKVHHVNHGVEMKRLMEKQGLEIHLTWPGAKTMYASSADFFIAKLKR